MNREKIILAAVDCAKQKNYNTVTQSDIAKAAGVSPALVAHYCGSMDEIKASLLMYAYNHGVVPILAQAIGAGHISLSELDEKTCKSVLKHMQG